MPLPAHCAPLDGEAGICPECARAILARIVELEEEVHAASRAGNAAEIKALHLLARVREALGDNGKRMQDELLEYCRELRDSAGALAALGEEYDALKAERDRYRAALREMSDELSHYPEGAGVFGHLKRILRRALA